MDGLTLLGVVLKAGYTLPGQENGVLQDRTEGPKLVSHDPGKKRVL